MSDATDNRFYREKEQPSSKTRPYAVHDAVRLVMSLPNPDDVVRRYVADALLGEIDRLHAALVELNTRRADEPRECTHPVLVDDHEQPGVNIYLCAACKKVVRVNEFESFVREPEPPREQQCPHCFAVLTLRQDEKGPNAADLANNGAHVELCRGAPTKPAAKEYVCTHGHAPLNCMIEECPNYVRAHETKASPQFEERDLYNAGLGWPGNNKR